MANRLVEMVAQQALRYGDREVFRSNARKEAGWHSTSWREFASASEDAAAAICTLGVGERENVAICSHNTSEILITEIAAFRNRDAAIPIYAASSQDQFDYIVSDGEARILFVGGDEQLELAVSYVSRHPDKIKAIVTFHAIPDRACPGVKIIGWSEFMTLGRETTPEIRNEVARRTAAGVPDDMATLIYTSGTTGAPKGVELCHSNYDAAIEMHMRRLTNVSDADLSMAFLPMSHILEKAWCFFCLSKGIRIAINYDPRVIQDTIHEVHPNIMCCVPRFWEKVYVSVRDKLGSMSWPMRMVVKEALRIGRLRNLKYKRIGKQVPAWLECRYNFYDKLLFAKLKSAIGIPDPNMFPTAGAPLSDKICEFMRSVGIDIIVGYGLSETTATVTCFPERGYVIGTVGTPLDGIDVKISHEGEILVKAPTVTPGYYHNPDANAESFTTDGFFRTGDSGYFDKSGALVLTERIKDLFKTANGKYVAPQALESRLAENKYIDEVAVIGEGRKFVSALIVPNFPNLRRWAMSKGIDTEDTASMLADERVRHFMMKQVESVQSSMATYEQIKRIALLPNHFSIMNGEVTNTMKVRRPVVARRYAREIEKMYKE